MFLNIQHLFDAFTVGHEDLIFYWFKNVVCVKGKPQITVLLLLKIGDMCFSPNMFGLNSDLRGFELVCLTMFLVALASPYLWKVLVIGHL